MTNEQRIEKLERELAELKAIISMSPSALEIDKNVIIKGRVLVYGDFECYKDVKGEFIYTKRSGSYAELTT